jgi:hypothetical protein
LTDIGRPEADPAPPTIAPKASPHASVASASAGEPIWLDTHAERLAPFLTEEQLAGLATLLSEGPLKPGPPVSNNEAAPDDATIALVG